MHSFIWLSFLVCTGAIALWSWHKTRKSKLDTAAGYFLGGRSLTAGVISGSLIMTNLSATTFMGMSGQAFSTNLSVIGWEIGSAITLILVAMILIPRYLAQGISTIPQFLETRYGKSTSTIITILFMLGYIVNTLPPALYAGAVALDQLFNIQLSFGITFTSSLWISVIVIGVIGAIYAVFGGLKAIAISDSIYGIILLVTGIMVPVCGLMYLGHGSFSAGLHDLVSQHSDKLNAIGSTSDPIPFGAMFTGIILVNLYYWGTDQSIMQRALGAKDLKNAQKGILITGVYKTLTPIICIIPGIIAFHIFGAQVNPDTVYSKLASLVLPKFVTGIFAAAFFGAILSTFNGVLNSVATLFAMNIYKPLYGGNVTDKTLIRSGKLFAAIVAVFSILLAPMIRYAPNGLLQYIQVVNGFFNVPIFTVLIVGYFFRRVPAFAANISLILFIVTYGIFELVIKPDMSFLYLLTFLFIVYGALMVILGKLWPMAEPFVLPKNSGIVLTKWAYRYEAAVFVIWLAVCNYIVFSPIGLAGGNMLHMMEWLVFAAIVAVIAVLILRKYKQSPSEPSSGGSLSLNSAR